MHLIGNRNDVKVSFSERQEILRLQEENTLTTVYQYLIERLNEFEISIWDDKFYSEMLGEQMTENHLVCLLSKDLAENCPVSVSKAVARKLSSWLLKALISSCQENGVVELNAQDLLGRIANSVQDSRSQRP